MKDIGIIRKASQGRIVFPIEMRRALNWDDETELEIFSDGNGVFVQKYEPACVFCGSGEDILHFETKRICKNCLKKLQMKTCFTAKNNSRSTLRGNSCIRRSKMKFPENS